MSKLFKRNNNDASVNEETREWLEEYFLWLINTFGKENIKKRKVLTPDFKDFPIQYNGQKQSAIDTLEIVASQLELNPDEISLHIYKEGQQEIDTGSPFGHRLFLQNVKGQKYSAGVYLGKQESEKYLVGLEEKKLNDPIAMVATIAHALCHIKLLGEQRTEINNEYLTDLTTIVFGLGIFNANEAFKTVAGFDFWGWRRSGYLTQQQWGYALALFSYLREEENPEWINFLSVNVKGAFKKSLNFIQHNSEELYKKKHRTIESKPKDSIKPTIYEAKKNRDFETLVNLYKEKLTTDPDNKIFHNNIGYYLLQQKKYKEAIEYFDKGIKIAPKYDFLYNNRGYCKLQLEDIRSAYEDIKKACELNPFNSFAWRNLGAYYLKINDFEKALENFEEAEKIDSNTELINFYLGKAHEKLGNKEKAQAYFHKSIELNEYNDSMLDDIS